MSAARRAQNANKGLQRRKALREAKPAFLIVTEGEKTEPNYFVALRRFLRIPRDLVRTEHPSASDPVSLLNAAKKLRDEARRTAQRQEGIHIDFVWLVFDREGPGNARTQQAATVREKVSGSDISIAESVPSFEFWLLLHHTYTTRQFHDANEVVTELKKSWPTYTKDSTPDEALLQAIPDAVQRAAACRQHHKNAGGDGNPSTDVDLLVLEMNESAAHDAKITL
ncbi:MAG: RloB domain-containing protein [Ignavibacteriae bacterium]|nr:RloB domain-containing protein [Ignavibacteriota bacterium]